MGLRLGPQDETCSMRSAQAQATERRIWFIGPSLCFAMRHKGQGTHVLVEHLSKGKGKAARQDA